jgi:hypothetical protein
MSPATSLNWWTDVIVRSASLSSVGGSRCSAGLQSAGLGGSHPLTVHAKMLRLELLKVKADPERELGTWSLNCSKCGLNVHWGSGLGVAPGHWRTGSAPRGMRTTGSV